VVEREHPRELALDQRNVAAALNLALQRAVLGRLARHNARVALAAVDREG
jgi:hypothetical protein